MDREETQVLGPGPTHILLNVGDEEGSIKKSREMC